MRWVMADLVFRGGEVPVIETERLRLRGHRPEDFADCAAMWADRWSRDTLAESHSPTRMLGPERCDTWATGRGSDSVIGSWRKKLRGVLQERRDSRIGSGESSR